MQMFRSLTLGCLLLAVSTCPTRAQTPAPPPSQLPILKDRPGTTTAPDATTDILGPRFESRAAGIALRGLAGAKEFRGGAGSDVIIEYTLEQPAWVLTVSKTTLQRPRPLKDSPDGRRIGLLSATVDEFHQMHGDAEVLRKVVVNNAEGEVGLFVMRYLQGTHRKLLQEAMFPASGQFYYVVSLMSPAGPDKGIPDDPLQVDPGERRAADAFRQVVDSVRVLDRSGIRTDQENRLLHTRDVLKSMHESGVLKKAIVPEQYFRLLRDGKDIGYTCVFEQVAERDARQGVLISMRARTAPEPGAVASVTSQMFLSLDWRTESWHHIALAKAEKKQTLNTELGVSNVESRLVVEREPTTAPAPGAPAIAPKPTVKEVEECSLDVRTSSRRTIEGKAPQSLTGVPVKKKLPPWYLPQAAQKMLPRLLPLDKPQTYLFATYVSDSKEVMARYIDVTPAEDVTLGGKRVKAVAIYDKVGIEGAATIHYISPEGVYLGNSTTYVGATPNATTIVQLVPAAPADIKRLWPDADLSKPAGAEFEQSETAGDRK